MIRNFMVHSTSTNMFSFCVTVNIPYYCIIVINTVTIMTNVTIITIVRVVTTVTLVTTVAVIITTS